MRSALNPLEEAAPVVSEDVNIADDRNTLSDSQDSIAVEFASSQRKVEEDAITSNSVSIFKLATVASEVVEVDGTSPKALLCSAKKSGKKSPEQIKAIKELIEANLEPGQQIETEALANLTGLTVPGIRHRRNVETLHELSLQLVPDSKPEKFERI